MTPSELDELLARLSRDRFRSRFAVRGRELAWLQTWGLEKAMKDAREFLRTRVAPAEPKNDGRQTPWGNHPAFIAQHATATCCRGCIEKWHGIPKGRELTGEELDRLLAVMRRWLERFVRED